MAKKDQALAADDGLVFRPPTPEDGTKVHDLIAASPPLDENSLYANLIQCTHFADTCILAVDAEGRTAGWVSGYLPPVPTPGRLVGETFFVWQVAVAETARGKGLGPRMVLKLLERPAAARTRYLQTTVTPDNKASWALFGKVAKALDADMGDRAFFEKDTHFAGHHDTEHMVTIGPFHPRAAL